MPSRWWNPLDYSKTRSCPKLFWCTQSSTPNTCTGSTASSRRWSTMHPWLAHALFSELSKTHAPLFPLISSRTLNQPRLRPRPHPPKRPCPLHWRRHRLLHRCKPTREWSCVHDTFQKTSLRLTIGSISTKLD